MLLDFPEKACRRPIRKGETTWKTPRKLPIEPPEAALLRSRTWPWGCPTSPNFRGVGLDLYGYRPSPAIAILWDMDLGANLSWVWEYILCIIANIFTQLLDLEKGWLFFFETLKKRMTTHWQWGHPRNVGGIIEVLGLGRQHLLVSTVSNFRMILSVIVHRSRSQSTLGTHWIKS